MFSKALVVLSGGQDSTTCLFWAKRHFDEVHAITFDYGQRHVLEVDAAVKVAALAQVTSHEILRLPGVLKATSPLVSGTALERYADFAQMDKVIGERIELTFVPMRNTFFLTLAANRAVALGCRNLVTGICQEDNANYPDCTEAFRAAFQDMTNQSLSTCNFRVHAPLMYLSKAQTVLMALGDPRCWNALAYTHTSYDGQYPPVDLNHANLLRAHGFAEAGFPDPLVLRAVKEGLMDLPPTPNYRNIQLALFEGSAE